MPSLGNNVCYVPQADIRSERCPSEAGGKAGMIELHLRQDELSATAV